MFKYPDVETLFSYCAWGGTILYFFRLLIGFGGAVDSEPIDSTMGPLSDDAFHFLSLNTLLGFLMLFGWGGLAASRQFLFSEPLSLIIALFSGIFYVFVTRFIFKNAKKLTSAGTVLNIHNAIGKQGSIYQEIKPNKVGVVQVNLDHFTREFDAKSIDNQEISSFQVVDIIKVINNNTLLVKKIK